MYLSLIKTQREVFIIIQPPSRSLRIAFSSFTKEKSHLELLECQLTFRMRRRRPPFHKVRQFTLRRIFAILQAFSKQFALENLFSNAKTLAALEGGDLESQLDFFPILFSVHSKCSFLCVCKILKYSFSS